MPISSDKLRTTRRPADGGDPSSFAFGQALQQGLRLPLCAMRATLESLQRELPRGSEEALLVRGAIEQATHVEQGVHDLIDHAVAPVPDPLDTSVHEILEAALRPLEAKGRARVRRSIVGGSARLFLDPSVAAKALRRLLSNALEASPDDVLVIVRAGLEGGATFAIVNDGSQAQETRLDDGAFHSTKPNHLGLGLTLAHRDVSLLGGTVQHETLRTGGTRVLMELPAPAAGASADAAYGEAA